MTSLLHVEQHFMDYLKLKYPYMKTSLASQIGLKDVKPSPATCYWPSLVAAAILHETIRTFNIYNTSISKTAEHTASICQIDFLKPGSPKLNDNPGKKCIW